MVVIFMARNGYNIDEVARVDEDFNWSGDPIVIENLKETFRERGITEAGDLIKCPVVFTGSYFWAYIA